MSAFADHTTYFIMQKLFLIRIPDLASLHYLSKFLIQESNFLKVTLVNFNFF